MIGIKTKNRRNFLEYYKSFKDKIYNFFWYRVGLNRDKAEDLTSEVFVKAFESFDSYDQERPFQAWIYRIAQNHLINHYRIAKREVGLPEIDNSVSNELAYCFERDIEIKFELEKVMKVINSMEDYHREVLLLRYVDSLDNAEIATVLGKEEGAVRAQISRGLKLLRNKLK